MTEPITELQIILYPHPTLRRKSKPILRVDQELRKVLESMFELMYVSGGVGLAANQVDIPLRMCVINPSGKKGEGEELVLLNPVLDRPKGTEEDSEGCLSIPGVNGNVVRSKQAILSAYDLQGRAIDRLVSGYLARIIQHELDHLDGVLFIDRISPENRREQQVRLDELEVDFASRQRMGSLKPNEMLIAQADIWEQRYA
jgi:peptide deformylase